MKSAFFEYQVAMTGLFTARTNLNVINHNISNSPIPGYSRQVTLQRAARPLTLYDGRGMYGTGSDVYGIDQIRDIYLDRKFWSQKAVYGEYVSKSTQSAFIENVFNDLSDTGVRASFVDFFNRLQDLTTNAPDATYRTNVISAADSLAEMIRNNAEALQKQQRDLNIELEGYVQRINGLGAQITSLNRQIYQYELGGENANDLRDQRALLVDELSEYVNVQVDERDYGSESVPNDKRFTVMINGYEFVNHFDAQSLTCVPRDMEGEKVTLDGKKITIAGDGTMTVDEDVNKDGQDDAYTGLVYDQVTVDGNSFISHDKKNIMDNSNLFDIYFTNSGTMFDIYSPSLQGTIKGLVDMRDGNNGNVTLNKDGSVNVAPEGGQPGDTLEDRTTTNYKGVPFYMNKLNTLCRTFARAINEGLDTSGSPIPDVIGHMDGYDENGINTGAPSGILLFTATSGKVDLINALPLNDPDGGPTDPANQAQYITLPGGGQGIDYSRLTCLTIAVNPILQEDQGRLATSSGATIGESNNDVILGFNKINTYASLFKEGKLSDFIIGTSDQLAIDRMQSINFEASYEEITMATDNQRMSVSGVSLNEELMSMIKYQQLFTACSRMVNVIDSIYDTMINRLGNF